MQTGAETDTETHTETRKEKETEKGDEDKQTQTQMHAKKEKEIPQGTQLSSESKCMGAFISSAVLHAEEFSGYACCCSCSLVFIVLCLLLVRVWFVLFVFLFVLCSVVAKCAVSAPTRKGCKPTNRAACSCRVCSLPLSVCLFLALSLSLSLSSLSGFIVHCLFSA